MEYFSYISYGTPYIYAFLGMVWWKVVSKTTTLGTFSPNTALALRRPCTWAMLCTGARGAISSILSMMASVTISDLVKNSAPCTTRWPMAEISLLSFTTAPSPLVIISTTFINASVWVGKGTSCSHSPPLALCVILLPSMPMRSHRPLHSTRSPSISMS